LLPGRRGIDDFREIDMRAITVAPGAPESARLEDLPEPLAEPGALLVEAVALGVCGTDIEILTGVHGAPPPGRERMVLGHESLGRVVEAPGRSGFEAGDRVVGIVRRPDPAPCHACAGGEWDMCENGLYTERGIRGRDGYGAERFRLDPAFAVKVDPALGIAGVLLEPASVLAKAWDHIERIGHRTRTWSPRRVLVTGAGPVGLLAALMAAQRGHEVHVFDRVAEGVKPELVRQLGGTYHSGDVEALAGLAPDIVLECTGAGPVVLAVMRHSGRNAIVCLTGLSASGREIALDAAGLNRSMVLENDVVFGSVNANRAHYELAAEALAKADRAWLERLITRRVPLDRWREAYERRPDDVKVILDFGVAA
jgi:threonine dehydrogenase-like Zn-dependent dehydrogenase